MNTSTHVEPTDTIEAIIHNIIDAQIAGDEDEIQALIEKLDALYSERNEKHEDYIHVIRNAEIEAKALNTLAKLLRGTLLDDMIQHEEKQTKAGKFRLSRRNGPPRVVLHIDAGDCQKRIGASRQIKTLWEECSGGRGDRGRRTRTH